MELSVAVHMTLVMVALTTLLVGVMVWQTRGEVMESGLEGTHSTTVTARRLLRVLKKYNPRANETTPQLIQSNGYPAETHRVVTQDDYILQIHRIPFGRSRLKTPVGEENAPRPVAFLHHCLLCSSSDFVMNTPDKALAYMLADAGYDVWLANARGNTYSRNHLTLSPDSKAFWQFSWNEMAIYDVPAAIDYILNTTNQKDLYYVGFSMGTSVFWAMLSERPHYAAKIRFMVAMGPVAYLRNIKGPLGYAAPFVNQIELTLNLLGQYELLSFGPFIDRLLSTFCDEKRLTSYICSNILFLLCGPNPQELNKEFLPVMLSHTPAGTSVHTITHYLQLVNSGKFRKYDYGKINNYYHYKLPEPPIYNLSRVTTPVAVFWSDNDWLADPQDVSHLVAELPNVVYKHRVTDPHFTHLDFVWALHADKLVYQHLLQVLAQY